MFIDVLIGFSVKEREVWSLMFVFLVNFLGDYGVVLLGNFYYVLSGGMVGVNGVVGGRLVDFW